MRHTWIRYIAIALLVVMLVGLCGCDLFANFNDGMPKGTNRGEYPPEYSYDKSELAREAEARREMIKNVAISIVAIVVGIIGLAAPQALWWVEMGWMIRDAEPSDAALVVNRIIGGLLIFVGVMMLIMSLAG